jgi:hypothetical protein
MTDHDVLEHRLDAIDDKLGGLTEQIVKQNGRVDRLESWRDRMTGAWIVVTFASPVIAGLIVGFILGK